MEEILDAIKPKEIKRMQGELLKVFEPMLWGSVLGRYGLGEDPHGKNDAFYSLMKV